MIYDIEVLKRDGSKEKLDVYKDKVMLIVNTATGCGFTPQYKGLEDLFQKYNDKGLEILDFPCNQFGNQAPESNDEIHEFCQLKYNTSFDQYAKIDCNGKDESELFKFLKSQNLDEVIGGMKDKITMKAIAKISHSVKDDNDIKWNFTKFLVNRNGEVVARFAPTVEPNKIEEKIKELL